MGTLFSGFLPREVCCHLLHVWFFGLFALMGSYAGFGTDVLHLVRRLQLKPLSLDAFSRAPLSSLELSSRPVLMFPGWMFLVVSAHHLPHEGQFVCLCLLCFLFLLCSLFPG
jgi:hypothetical protein